MSINTENTFVWPYDFTCTIVNDKIVVPNHYSIAINIEPKMPVESSIGLGFHKLRYFANEVLPNSMFISKDSPFLETFNGMETNLIVLPCEPYDYYVGSIIFSKFLSITEKYFDINQLTIDSAIGDRIQYTIWDPADCGLDLSGDHWWNWDDVTTNPNEVITWKDLNLKENSKFEPVVVKGGLSGS